MKIVWESGQVRYYRFGAHLRGVMLDHQRPVGIVIHPQELHEAMKEHYPIDFGQYYAIMWHCLKPNSNGLIEIKPYDRGVTNAETTSS